MIFEPLSAGEIDSWWGEFSQAVEPAVRDDPGADLADVRDALEARRDLAFWITDPGKCALVVQVDDDAACWIKYLAGHIEGGPRARLTALLDGVAHIERTALSAGCSEVRVCGRRWRVLELTGYQLLDGYPNGLRKVLAPMIEIQKAA